MFGASDEGVERLLRGVRIAHGVQGERERLWNLGFVRETLEEDVEVFERASRFADVAVELRLREAVLVILGVQQERLVEARQRAHRGSPSARDLWARRSHRCRSFGVSCTAIMEEIERLALVAELLVDGGEGVPGVGGVG